MEKAAERHFIETIIKYQGEELYLILKVMNREGAKVFEWRGVMIKVVCEEDGYNILFFLDYLKASRFWWLLNDNKNNNFVLNYYVPDTLLSALYVLAHLALILCIEQSFKVIIVTIPISLNEETQAQVYNLNKVITQI